MNPYEDDIPPCPEHGDGVAIFMVTPRRDETFWVVGCHRERCEFCGRDRQERHTRTEAIAAWRRRCAAHAAKKLEDDAMWELVKAIKTLQATAKTIERTSGTSDAGMRRGSLYRALAEIAEALYDADNSTDIEKWEILQGHVDEICALVGNPHEIVDELHADESEAA